MDARRKEIQSLEQEIAALEERIARECGDIGRRLADMEIPADAPQDLLKYLSNIRAMRRSAAAFHEDIRRITDLAHRAETLRREIEEHERLRRKLLAECEERYEEIGAAAYEVFRTSGDTIEHRDLFRQVMDLDDEIRRHEEAIKRVEEEERQAGFLERLIRHKGRKVVLRGAIHRAEKAKLKAFSDVGRRVVESEFARRIQDRAGPALEFVMQRRGQADQLAAQNAERAAELTRCEQELRDLGVATEPKDRIRDLEKSISEVERELGVLYVWAGQCFVDRDLRTTIRHEELESKCTLIGGIQKTIQEKRRRADALRAELETEAILENEKKLKARRKALEEELRVRERQIAVIDIEIHMGRQRLEELRRVIHEGAPYREPEPLPTPPDLYRPPGEPPSSNPPQATP